MPAKIPLYEKLAIDLAQQIESGTFRPGERLPSVRELSSQRSLSITTVLQSYHLLEDQGIVESEAPIRLFCHPASPADCRTGHLVSGP